MENLVPRDEARPDITFFELIVRPTVFEFLEEPLDVRRACLAALVLASLADHHYATFPNIIVGGKGNYRKHLSRLRPDFALVCDVAEATKHAALRGDGKGLKFDQVRHRPSPPVGGGWNSGNIGWNVLELGG